MNRYTKVMPELLDDTAAAIDRALGGSSLISGIFHGRSIGGFGLSLGCVSSEARQHVCGHALHHCFLLW
jgi:hypothetical protein